MIKVYKTMKALHFATTPLGFALIICECTPNIDIARAAKTNANITMCLLGPIAIPTFGGHNIIKGQKFYMIENNKVFEIVH